MESNTADRRADTMVKEVNYEQVAPEERLVDHAYKYINGIGDIVY